MEKLKILQTFVLLTDRIQYSYNSEKSPTLAKNGMFSGSYEVCGKIIPVSYVQQAQNARKSRENQIRIFLEHVSSTNRTK